MSSFNVAQIIPSLESGGAERGTIDVSNYLSKIGINNNIISNGGRLLEETDKNFTNHFKLPVDSKNFISFPFIATKINKIIKKNNISIVHIRSRGPACILRLANTKNIKTISTFHNVYSGTSFIKKLYNKQLANADKVVAISNYVKNEIINKYKIDKEKVEVINRGVDVDYYDKKLSNDNIEIFLNKNSVNPNKKIILYPARLTNWKGHLEFLDVFKKINDQNYLLYFVGDTKNKSYSQRVQNKINNLNLTNNCKILGNLNKHDLKIIYHLSSIIISLPLQPEGFGRVVSEALVMGKKILAFNYGGVKDQLSGLDDIYKAEPLVYDNLHLKLRDLVNIDNEKFLNISNNSREHIINNFSKEQMVKKYFNLYEKISL